VVNKRYISCKGSKGRKAAEGERR